MKEKVMFGSIAILAFPFYFTYNLLKEVATYISNASFNILDSIILSSEAKEPVKRKTTKDVEFVITDETMRSFKLLASQIQKQYNHRFTMTDFMLFILDRLEDEFYYNEEQTVERLRRTRSTVSSVNHYVTGRVVYYQNGPKFKMELKRADYKKLELIATGLDYRITYEKMEIEDLVGRAAQMFFDEYVDRKRGLEDIMVNFYKRNEEEIRRILEEEEAEKQGL